MLCSTASVNLLLTLQVPVGRRLGYPLKLVVTKAHVFVRWDDGRERFNIETAGNGGTGSYSDEYYRSWPEKWLPAEAKAKLHEPNRATTRPAID